MELRGVDDRGLVPSGGGWASLREGACTWDESGGTWSKVGGQQGILSLWRRKALGWREGVGSRGTGPAVDGGAISCIF